MTLDLRETSDRLHERVQGFAAGTSSEGFDELALSIARFQAEASQGYRRLLRSRRVELARVADIAPVPSDAFRLTRVAAFGPELDALRFYTSGTTGSERGTHAMRRPDTYEKLSLAFGRRALLGSTGRAVVVALAPQPTTPPTSSLGYMMARFMEAFDGEPLGGREAAFSSSSPGRWLLSENGIHFEDLEQARRTARERGLPLLLLGTAFALVRLVDDLGDSRLPLPPGSAVMQTGGFKGRSREITMEELRTSVSRALELDSARVVGEYGMTELTSQLYEASIVESELGRERSSAGAGVYFEPPWLRVTPVDPVSLDPVAEGEVGLARFLDLGNVDSAVSVVTQDLVRRARGGVQLLGRQRGAPARGCSLAIEALLGG